MAPGYSTYTKDHTNTTYSGLYDTYYGTETISNSNYASNIIFVFKSQFELDQEYLRKKYQPVYNYRIPLFPKQINRCIRNSI